MNKPNYYAILKAEIRYDKRLSAFAKLIYAEVTALANKEGYCWANNYYFAKNFETTERTVQRALSKLEDLGYIKKELENDSRKIYIGATNLSEPHDKNVIPPHDKNVVHNTIKDNNIKEYIYDRDLESFEKFWKGLEGRKIAKPAAFKAYTQIDTELSAEELASKFNILLQSREEKFCPYPQKWLKNEGWNDNLTEKAETKAYIGEEKIYRDKDGYIISKEEYKNIFK